jgi:hypothetical protein
MAQPPLEFLAGAAKIAAPFLRKAAAAGVKATAVLDVLRAFGLRFSTQQMLDVYAAIQGRADLERYLRIVPPNVTLPPEAHVLNPSPQRVNYQYLIQVTHPVLETPRFATISSDVPLSASTIKAQTELLFRSSETTRLEEGNFSDAEVTILEAKRSAGAP